MTDDDPLMSAWKAYKETEEYRNTLAWCGKPTQKPEGPLWAAFMAGFSAHSTALEQAGYAVVPVEPTGEMWSAGRDKFDKQASKFACATRYVDTLPIADVSPKMIWQAMLAAYRDETGRET